MGDTKISDFNSYHALRPRSASDLASQFDVGGSVGSALDTSADADTFRPLDFSFLDTDPFGLSAELTIGHSLAAERVRASAVQKGCTPYSEVSTDSPSFP